MTTGLWNLDGWPKPEEWSAFWAFSTFLVAGIAAWVALSQFRAYLREQEERARPYVVVDFWFKANFSLYIVIENISATPATNLTLAADPMVKSSVRDSRYNIDLAELFGGEITIPQLAPGRVMRWYVDSAPDIFASTELPHRYEVTVNYTDPRRRITRTGAAASYSDTFVLDLDAYGIASGDDDYGNKMWNIAKNNEQRLESMKRSLQSVAAKADRALQVDEAPSSRRRPSPMQSLRRRRQQRN